jgi:MFS family permease
MSSGISPAAVAPQAVVAWWSPFRQAAFVVMWSAAVVSNIGSWMSSAASGWLMTTLDPSPLIVSMVQVAGTLPMCLFAVPAGALADILDRRKFLLVVEGLITVVCAGYAVVVSLGLATPFNLLLFTFLNGVGSALTAPAWQAVTPQLVPRGELRPAVAANSAGVNVSRSIGPAVGGVLVARAGIALPFWINAISNFGILGALLWWRPPQGAARMLPAERFLGAIHAGFRYAANNPHLRATLIRTVAFFLFASAYWALLPLVARRQIAGGPDLYGYLLGTIGVGAVAGAFALPWLNARFGPDRAAAGGTIGTAVAMVLFGLARDPVTGLAASLVAGVSWIVGLSSLNVSAQVALPDWVRARGLAIYVTVFTGALTLGSAIWGQVAGSLGLMPAHFIAAAGALVAIPLTARWKLQTAADIDLTPSSHWPAPILAREIQHDRGPVLVTIEYRIEPGKRAPFLAAMEKVGEERRRDGAYEWAIFEDAATEGLMVETFLVASWLEHLRQHGRVTNADRVLQDAVLDAFQCEGPPVIRHFIAPKPDPAAPVQENASKQKASSDQ